MLTMPSVSSVSNLASRPMLVADVVRPAAPQRAIEPTTAVSKERSRAENKSPDTSTAAASALYTANGKSKAAERFSGANGANGDGVNAEAARALEESRNKDRPPAEKSEIQKAMEAQVKELLANVWKASAKAVDFLLQRDSEVTGQMAVTTLEPAALLGKKASAVADRASDAPAKTERVSYNAQGGRLPEDPVTAGQLLDVLA